MLLRPLHKEIRSLAVRFHIPVPLSPTYRTTYESCAWPTMCIWLAAGPSVECTHTLRGAYACVIISRSCATGQRLALLRWGLKELWNSCRLPDTALSPPTKLQTNVTLHNAPPMLTDSSLSKTRLLFWGKSPPPLVLKGAEPLFGFCEASSAP